MLLCLDIGNSQIFGGLFIKEDLKIQFRKTSQIQSSSDELGVFFRSVLRENQVEPDEIDEVVVCCVVPELLYSVRACCQKYFDVDPLILRPGVKTGLKILYKDPKEVGADRIADAVGAISKFPGTNLILADFGTATTICAINKKKEFIGGSILPGVRLAMEALESRTAQLPSVEIKAIKNVIGKSTVESIQSGLYWSNVGMIKEFVKRITKEQFSNERPLVIGTGGFANLFSRERIFDEVVSDLILIGLKEINSYNK